jgi:hypothetical protein
MKAVSRSKMRPIHMGNEAKRYSAVAESASFGLGGDGVDAELVGEGNALEIGNDGGMRVGRSAANWRISRMTGGRPRMKKTAMAENGDG